MSTILESIRQWAEDVFMPYGGAGLFVLAFSAASFFPVPPDIILALMCLDVAGSPLCLWYALVCTVGSVLGGIFGYFLGFRGGRPMLEKLASGKKIRRAEAYYARYGAWAVAVAGFTLVPYKIFTITSGMLKMDLKKFVLASCLSRGARFFLEAMLIMIWGQEIYDFTNKHFWWVTLAMALVVVLAFRVKQKMENKCLEIISG